MPRQSAFTLLELLIVLAVASILIAVTTPAIRSWIVRAEIQQSSSLLIEVINEAKRRAVTDGELWIMQFSEKDCALILLPTNPTPPGTNRSRQTTDKYQLSPRVTFKFMQPQQDLPLGSIQLSPIGSITPARILLFRNQSMVESYVTNRLTGDVRRLSRR